MPLGKSPILLTDLMAEGDNNKHLLFNTALIKLEDAGNRALSVNLAAGNVSLTETQITHYGVFLCSGHSVTRNLTIPPTVGTPPNDTNRVFAVRNTGTGTVVVTHGSGVTLNVPASTAALVYANGTDIISLGGVSTNATIEVSDEGGVVAAALEAINFVGNGVVASFAGSTVTVTVTDTRTFLGLTDTPADYTGDAGKVVVVNSAETALEFADRIDTFLELTDTPADYTGDAGKMLAVNGAGTAVEFVSPLDTFLELTDTPNDYTGAGGKFVAVDAGGTELEFVDPPVGIAVNQEDTLVAADVTLINFTGAGVVVTDSGAGEIQVDIETGSIALDDAGVEVTPLVTRINFVGAAITDGGGGVIEVDVTSGGGSSVAVDDEGTEVIATAARLNFAGSGVTVTDAGGGEATITIPGGGSAVAVDDEGTEILATPSRINFAGAGVTVTDAGGGEALVTIPGGGSAIAIDEEGTEVIGTVTRLNFVGSPVTVTDAGGGEATITITGGGGGSGVAVEDEGTEILAAATRINFAGTGVTVTDAGSGEALVTIPGNVALRIEDEGSSVIADFNALNFAGAGVVVTDAGSGEALITISGAGSATFLSLTDTPSAYTSAGGMLVRVNAGATAIEFVEDNVQSGKTADFTLTDADLSGGQVFRCDKATDLAVTVAPSLTRKSTATFLQTGAGKVVMTPGAGVTLVSAGGALKTRVLGSALTLLPHSTSPNVYYVFGDITA